MRLDESCEKVFARHETFHPRYGWLKKAFDAANLDADLFNRQVAVVRMGVGKNMVRSIRHWGLAFKVLEPVKVAGRRVPTLRPSPLGRAWLDSETGVDPYMELPGTDWLMHWWLLAPVSQAPVWWLAFNEFSAIEFTEEQLLTFVADRLDDFGTPNPTSIKKDVSVFLRMYSSGHNVRATFEDKIDCPFRDLGLLQPSMNDGRGYRFLVGEKPTLPSRVFAATVLDFTRRTDPNARVVNLSRALTEPGAPGRAFRLTDDAVIELLREASSACRSIRLGSSNGIPQLTLHESPADATKNLLAEHYADHGVKLDWQIAADTRGSAA